MLVKDWVQDRVDYAVEDIREEIAQQLIVEAKENNKPFEKLAQRLENFFDADFADKMLAKYYK